MQRKGLILSLTLGLAALGVVVFLVLALMSRYRTYTVPLRSMEPTIPRDSRITVESFDALPARTVEHGDIVIFQSPKAPEENYVQRLLALPGDRIEVRARQVFRNDELVFEPYAQHERASLLPPGHPSSCFDNLPALEVPPLHAFLMGDNRDSVMDSRCWGPIPFTSIKGRVIAIEKPIRPR